MHLPIGQSQIEIPIEVFSDTVKLAEDTGVRLEAIRTGNNAAWRCACGYSKPLLGRTGSGVHPATNTLVQCGGCKRCYFLLPESPRGRVLMVREVTPPITTEAASTDGDGEPTD